jgi:predicted phosphoadenosine phosphosulfate sulfurtransferase
VTELPKVYTDINVYDATAKRTEYIFGEFDNIMVAFSGGKDSGILLNLAYDYARENNMLYKLAMYHLDYEAQYQATTDYVTKCFESYPGIKKYWLCLPVAAQCAVNMEQDHWVPWDKDKKDIWVRDMPDHEAVINEDNVPFEFKKETWDYDVQNNFGKWYAGENGNTAVLIGIRTDESLNRQSAITSKNKVNQYKGIQWININPDQNNVANAYPIYDWRVEDIWIANGKFMYSYNKLYDLFYQAGLSIHDMRVASPFNDAAMGALKVYKAVEPHTWGKLIGRVNGVNFAGIYGNTTAMGWKSIKLPDGHTWKSYLKFLLDTLPEEARNNYIEKFKTSIKFWREKGGVLSKQTIKELENEGLDFDVGDKTNYKTAKKPVRFEDYPDDADITDFKSVPSYKRMCICIMKNDHTCKYMGFAQTKKEKEKRKATIAKYKNIIRGR